MANEIMYCSEFYNKIRTYVVFESHSQYEELKQIFNIRGLGFMIPGNDIIIIDGEKTADLNVLKWVEAHEIAHILLNHQSEYDADEEIQADLGAYLLLKQFSYSESCEMIIDYFNQRHGIDFPFNRLEEISKKLGL